MSLDGPEQSGASEGRKPLQPNTLSKLVTPRGSEMRFNTTPPSPPDSVRRVRRISRRTAYQRKRRTRPSTSRLLLPRVRCRAAAILPPERRRLVEGYDEPHKEEPGKQPVDADEVPVVGLRIGNVISEYRAHQ